MVNETSDRPRLTAKGARTRARIVEEAAALIHERGVAGTTLEDVKAAAEVSGSQMYHYFPDKDDLVQAVIDYHADAIVSRNRQALGSANGVEAWRKMVIAAARRTKAKGGCALGSLVGQLAENDPRPERSSRQGSISGQPPSAMDCDPFMPRGNSDPTLTRTTSPLLCSPRSKEGFCSPRCNGVAVRSKLRSIPSSPLPSADEPKPGSPRPSPGSAHGFWIKQLPEHDVLSSPAAIRRCGHLVAPGLAFCELILPTLTGSASWTWAGLLKADEIS